MMGWFWNPSLSGSTTNQQLPQLQAPTLASSDDRSSTADREIAKFWEELQEVTRSQPSPTSALTSQPQNTPASTSSWSRLPFSNNTTIRSLNPPPTSSRRTPDSTALSAATAPKTLSCRDLFDYAYHCSSIGGQLAHVYRYGTARECSPRWADFWFCMRVHNFAVALKEAEIRDRHLQKEEEKYYLPGKRSSEDVWESRNVMVERGTVFRAGFDDAAALGKGAAAADDVDENARRVRDLEYGQAEMERRRRARQELGYEN